MSKVTSYHAVSSATYKLEAGYITHCNELSTPGIVSTTGMSPQLWETNIKCNILVPKQIQGSVLPTTVYVGHAAEYK